MLTAPEEAIANWQNHSTEAVSDSSDKTLPLPIPKPMPSGPWAHE